MARPAVLLRLIGIAGLVGVLCAVWCVGTAAASTTATPTSVAPAAARSGALPDTGASDAIPLLALGLLATLCGAGVVIWSRRATRAR